MQLKLDIASTVKKVASALQQNGKNISREMANVLVTVMSERIFEEGKAANGGAIGTYNNKYLKLREKKYKRLEGSKVVVSLTRKLENNFSVVEAGDYYGIGVNNSKDADKMKWVEQHFNKHIATGLTQAESDLLAEASVHIIDRYLK